MGRFFLLAFAITWGLQLPGVVAGWLSPDRRDAYLPLAGLGIFGPLVATLLAHAEGGRASMKALYARVLRWRVHVGWYLMALAVAPPWQGSPFTSQRVRRYLAGALDSSWRGTRIASQGSYWSIRAEASYD